MHTQLAKEKENFVPKQDCRSLCLLSIPQKKCKKATNVKLWPTWAKPMHATSWPITNARLFLIKKKIPCGVCVLWTFPISPHLHLLGLRAPKGPNRSASSKKLIIIVMIFIFLIGRTSGTLQNGSVLQRFLFPLVLWFPKFEDFFQIFCNYFSNLKKPPKKKSLQICLFPTVQKFSPNKSTNSLKASSKFKRATLKIRSVPRTSKIKELTIQCDERSPKMFVPLVSPLKG